MSTPYKAPGGEGKSAAEELQRVHRIRITLTSKNVANLEKGAPPWRAGRGPPASALARREPAAAAGHARARQALTRRAPASPQCAPT